MTGQHGYRPSPGGQTVRYEAIGAALSAPGTKAIDMDAMVHMPRIGCGLASGHWELVKPLIVKRLVQRGVAVTVYDMPS